MKGFVVVTDTGKFQKECLELEFSNKKHIVSKDHRVATIDRFDRIT